MTAKAGRGKEVLCPWGRTYKCNRFIIILSIGEIKKPFTFYDSVNNYNKGITELNEESLKDAVSCIFDDAYAVINNPTPFYFCNEFGYSDEDYKEGVKVFKACCRTHDKLFELGFNDNSIVEFLNSIR